MDGDTSTFLTVSVVVPPPVSSRDPPSFRQEQQNSYFPPTQSWTCENPCTQGHPPPSIEHPRRYPPPPSMWRASHHSQSTQAAQAPPPPLARRQGSWTLLVLRASAPREPAGLPSPALHRKTVSRPLFSALRCAACDVRLPAPVAALVPNTNGSNSRESCFT